MQQYLCRAITQGSFSPCPCGHRREETACKVTGFRRISTQASDPKSYPFRGSKYSADLNLGSSVALPESGTKCLYPSTLVLMALSLCDLVLDMRPSMIQLSRVENVLSTGKANPCSSYTVTQQPLEDFCDYVCIFVLFLFFILFYFSDHIPSKQASNPFCPGHLLIPLGFDTAYPEAESHPFVYVGVGS